MKKFTSFIANTSRDRRANARDTNTQNDATNTNVNTGNNAVANDVPLTQSNNRNNNSSSNNNNDTEVNARPTFYDLTTAIQQDDLSEVERLLDNGVDINHAPSTYDTALHQALNVQNTTIFCTLLNYKDKQTNLRTANVDILTQQNATPLWRVVYRCVFSKYTPETDNPCLYLLLALGANLHHQAYHLTVKTVSAMMNDAPLEVKNMFLYEALIRGDLAFVKTLLAKKNISILVKAFIDYISKSQKETGEVRELNAELILPCIKELLADNTLSHEDKKELKKILHILKLYQFKFENQFELQNYEYPRCLIPYLKNKITHSSLEVLTAELQYYRGLLDAPAINERISNYKEGQQQEEELENDYLENLSQRKAIYAKENLFKFIHPNNRHFALLLLLTKPSILSIICHLALHPELSELQRKDCIALLQKYDDASSSDKKLAAASQSSSKDTQVSVSNMLTEATNYIVTNVIETLTQQNEALSRENKELKSDVNLLHQKVDDLNNKLELVINLLTTQQLSRANENNNNPNANMQNTMFNKHG